MDQLENKKIYGLYHGNLNNLTEIAEMQEFDLWRSIYNIESEIFWSMHESRSFDIDRITLEENQFALEYLMYQTTRFGVEMDSPKEGEHIKKSETYISWFQHWHDYVFFMDIDTKNKILEAKRKGEDISKYFQKNAWQDLHKKKLIPRKKIANAIYQGKDY